MDIRSAPADLTTAPVQRRHRPVIDPARHTRSLHKGTEDLVLDHYLEVLAHRPGALAGATALVSARATGVFKMGTNGTGTPHAARPGTATAPRH